MPKRVAVVGAGPAGLMVAERLAARAVEVTVIERMPSPARKFLMAGRGGLNLTHTEPLASFLMRYEDGAAPRVSAAVESFSPSAVRDWSESLGQKTFTGTSQRVFPVGMKASPLLRAWLLRLGEAGVTLRTRTTWLGFDTEGALRLQSADGAESVERFDATVLAVGGASWPRLGADDAWVSRLSDVPITPLQPANAGVRVQWSELMRTRFAGEPLKRVSLRVGDWRGRGEAIITETGLEGGLVYAAGGALRRALATGPATVMIDLRPDVEARDLAEGIEAVPAKQSMANRLRRGAHVGAVGSALMRELGPFPSAPRDLAALIKAVPLVVTGFAGMERAISTAGGVADVAIDEHWMLRARPGVFVAGEMVDWSAPTGGYLLTACFASGVAAAEGVSAWLASNDAGQS